MGNNGISSVTLSSLAEVRAAFLAKLEQSTLDEDDARTLKLQPYTATTAASLGLPTARAGFKIPYFNLTGRVSDFFRYRYLEYHSGNGFGALATANLKHPLRYAQPANTVNELYLPPLVPWKDVAANPRVELHITEGELKTACGCKHGLATIGLGGVWCFRSARARMPLLPAFKDFAWLERVVYLIYDSDAVTNPDVCRAEVALARALLALGARPFICRIPPLAEGAKTGLDDYIAARGVEEFKARVVDTAVEYRAAQELFALNEEVLYVEDPGLILRLDRMQRMSHRAFVEHAYAPRVYTEVSTDSKGNSKMAEKSAPKEWLKWTHRAVVRRITYNPAAAPRTVTAGEYNLWPGWGVEPQKGSIAPWEALLDFLFAGAEASHREWFERWLAYPLQHPGTKLYAAAILWGNFQGTGKSLVGYTMFEIYGASNAIEITEQELYAAFNDWAENKQFVMGEEITSTSETRRNVGDKLKSMVTRRQLNINPKYIPRYTVADVINYLFTSNHCDSFFLEENDRRFFVHEVKGRPLDPAFYAMYVKWLREEGGAAALFHYLLSLSLGDFNPAGHAPRTAARQEMIENTRSDLAVWVSLLKEDPTQILQVAGAQLPFKLYTTQELFKLYDADGHTRVTANGLARELRSAGFRKLNNGGPVKTFTAGLQRLWCVDFELAAKLENTKPNKLGEMYDAERKGKPVGQTKF